MTDDERERLRTLESAVSEIRVRQTQMELLLEQTAKATDQIKRDTSDIVELLRGASVLGRIARWIGVVAAAYLAGKGLKWW